jgi:hypothetical protein
MSLFLEAEFIPNNQEQELLNFIFSNDFAWFFDYAEKDTNKYGLFYHLLMKRNIENSNNIGIINSSYFKGFKDIFLKICKDNEIDVNVIYRASINRTYHFAEKYGHIHKDHTFPHKQFIWYLNDFTDAPTYIFDEEKNIIKTTSVGKNKISIFDNQNHAQGFCAPGETRIAVIFTFN